MYCGECGTKIENGKCPNCSKQDNSWVAITVLKCIFIPFIITIVLFFLSTLLFTILRIADITMPTIITTIVQVILPISILMFGWIVILLGDLKKHKK